MTKVPFAFNGTILCYYVTTFPYFLTSLIILQLKKCSNRGIINNVFFIMCHGHFTMVTT